MNIEKFVLSKPTIVIAMAAVILLQGCAAPPLEERRPGVSEEQYNLIVQKCAVEGEMSSPSPGLLHDYQAGTTAAKCVTFEQSKALAEGKSYRP